MYVVITLAYFQPVWTELRRKQIGDGGDAPEFLWNAWWMQQSLLQGGNPFFCEVIYAPYGVPLVWHSLVPLQSLGIALLNVWLPVQVAYNIMVLLALPLAAMCMYALARRVTSDHLAALVGGLVLMLCPYLVSKTLGHLDLLYGGFLPLYLLCLLQATQPEPPRPLLRWRLALLGVSALILFSCIVVAVFAVNLTVFVFCWRARSSEGWKRTGSRFLAAMSPTLLLGGAYAGLVLYYSVAYHYPPKATTALALCPEPAAYVLPFTVTSAWSGLVRGWGPPELGNVEMACYLGLGVMPLCVAGLVAWRRRPTVRFLAVVLASFLVLSLGPKLQLNREVVHLGPVTAYLPFGLWRYLPVLGAVGQTGRYMLICYVMMGLGVACLVAALGRRYGRLGGRVGAALCALVICSDYAFRPWVSDLPPMAELSRHDGRVLDPRLYNAATMYYQTSHGRPLVGGYISRVPQTLLARYRESPGIGWLFAKHPGAPGDRRGLLEALRELQVTDIMLAPGDWRAAALEEYGFRRYYEDGLTVTWAVPDSEAGAP